MLNWYQRVRKICIGQSIQFDKVDNYYEAVSESIDDIMLEYYRKGRKKGTMMSWSVIPFGKLKKIWEDYAQYSVVRDEAGLNDIAIHMLQNLARLHASTELSGHGTLNTDEYCKERGLKPIKDEQDFYWHFLETPYGTPISDYGLKPLWVLARQLFSSPDPKQKLVILDQMLNIIHQRGDLAALFVEGGASALSTLSASPSELNQPKA